MSEYITSPTYAGFLLTVPEFSFDIETNTEAPNNDWKDKYGLSFVADVTWVSFYAPGFAPVVFDLSLLNPDRGYILEFIRSVFNRQGYTVIGHNVVFDLRNLGGQLGFRVPLGSYVWDTLTTAITLLMGEDFKGDIALKSLAMRYNLFQDIEELEFMERMKTKRDSLHLAEAADVLRYVVSDSVITWRLYDMQKKIVESSNDPNVEPMSVIRDDKLEIELHPRGAKPRFLSTKRWSNLPELINWETRISRWCANQAIRGIRLDRDAVNTHLETLVEEYRIALDEVQRRSVATINNKILNKLATLIYFEKQINHIFMHSPKPNPLRWEYYPDDPVEWDQRELANWIHSQSLEDSLRISRWLMGLDGIFVIGEEYRENPPSINISNWIAQYILNIDEYESLTSDDLFKIEVVYNWYEDYFTRTKPIDPLKLANMKLFQPFYVFIISGKPLPENHDIARYTFLVTDKLRVLVETGADLDFRQEAFDKRALSFGEEATRFYFPKDNDDEPDDPFIVLLEHKAKINRIDEFMRHAERDGRIHSVVARKTRTGRATSTTMNLQNIDMKTFRGYLVPDTDDRVLIGIDISNAENWLLAMTFGDSELAKACASGDFHAQMTQAYWPELSKYYLENGMLDEFEALRKKSKFVTFGSAYGAGASKISRMIGTTKEEAQQLLDNRDRRFVNYSTGRKTLSGRIEKCYRDGHRPAFATLWTGRRIGIPMREARRRFMQDGKLVEKTRLELSAYKATNYLPQGGVGEIIWRTIVMASEYFEDNQIDAYVSLQVHDEIVLDVPVDRAFELAHIVINMLANIIPEEYRKRTVPNCRILSALGPDNSKKWGYRYDQPYLLPMDVFVNQWGTFQMPEGETKTPTWIGALHQGYTLESEIEDALQPVEEDEPVEAGFSPSEEWKKLPEFVSEIKRACSTIENHQTISRLRIGDDDKGLFDFPNRMLIQQELTHKGHQSGDEYWEVLQQIDALEQTLVHMRHWKQQMGL